MQWRKKRRLLYVIGSAHHALLIKQYRDNGDSLCSTNDEEGDGDRVSSSPTTPVNGSWSNGRPAFSPRGTAKSGRQRLGYQQSYRQPSQRGGYNDSKPPLVTTEKKTFNEEEYTKITTPRQDVLFKKGYLGRKKPALPNASNSAEVNATPPTDAPPLENAGVVDHEPPETPHFLYTNGFVDQGGVYYINGGSYELYDPYTGNVTVVVGPAPHGPPVLAAVSCQPVPLQPLEWFNPAFHSYVSAACPGRRKRSSTDSQNWSPQSSESTDPPGSPQEGEDMGLQNGSTEPLEDCTVYQHTHQPPAYVYPGYMFGPPVYNMNGINIQGLPPQPQSIDISGSKRRKKKRRRRRRRGGVEDGSDGSTSDENDLEEPVSLTSQESSQELESDSKTSAESANCKVQNGETNSSETTQQSLAGYPAAPEVKLSSNKSLTSLENEDNPEVPTTNSCVPQIFAGPVSQPLDFQDVNDVSLNSVNGTVVIQNSCDENVLNGPTKKENILVELNDKRNCNDGVNNYNLISNSGEGLVTINVVTSKEKSKGKRASKLNKQKHTQNNRSNSVEGQLTPTRVQSSSKMDGNENSNEDKDSKRTSNEAQPKPKPVPNHHEPLELPVVPRIAGSEDSTASSERLELPRKPSRKDQQQVRQQQQKQTQKKFPSSIHKERKEGTGGHKLSKPPSQISENQNAVQETVCIQTSSHSNECRNQSPPGTEICTKFLNPSEYVEMEPTLELKSTHSEHDNSFHNISRENLTEEENGPCSMKHRATKPSSISEHPHRTKAYKNETLRRNVDQNITTNILLGTDCSSRVQDNTIKESKSSINLEIRHSPPPVPPPRRKKWNPYNKRSPSERPPTPGRELDDRRSSEVLTDDSSSTSTSRESEDSVIEIMSSVRNINVAGLEMVKQNSSESEERVVFDTQLVLETVSSSKLHKTVSGNIITIDKPDSLLKEHSSTNIQQCAPMNVHNTDNRIPCETPHLSYTSHFLLADHSQQTQNLPSNDQSHQKLKKKTADDLLHGKTNKRISLPVVEVFSNSLACKVIHEAFLVIKEGKSQQTLAWPITEAVTKWLHSQTSEEVLTIPEICDSEHTEDTEEDTEEQNMNASEENTTGSKNVLRNPLPASSHKCKCISDSAGTRVASNNDEQMFSHNQECVHSPGVSDIGNKVHDINNNNKRIHSYTGIHADDIWIRESQSDKYNMIDSPDLLYSFPSKNNSQSIKNQKEFTETFSLPQNKHDNMIIGEDMEFDSDWECDSVLPKSSLISSVYSPEVIDSSESPDSRCLHMCNPALSVAKYYRLGPPAEKVDSTSQDQMSNSYTESDEEIDSLEIFRSELYDSAYDSSHRSLADELEFSEKPLPESWLIDQIQISQEKVDSTCGAFSVKYEDNKVSDSGIHSEESGNEDSRKPSTNSSNMFKNSSNLFNHNTNIHMAGITGEGPFPCGGICCILQ